MTKSFLEQNNNNNTWSTNLNSAKVEQSRLRLTQNFSDTLIGTGILTCASLHLWLQAERSAVNSSEPFYVFSSSCWRDSCDCAPLSPHRRPPGGYQALFFNVSFISFSFFFFNLLRSEYTEAYVGVCPNPVWEQQKTCLRSRWWEEGLL